MPNICMPEVGLEWVEAWALSGFVCFCITVQSVKARALDRWEACTNSLSYYSDLYGGLTKWKWIWKNTNDHGMQNFPRKEMIFFYILLSKWALVAFLDLYSLLVSNQLVLVQGAERREQRLLSQERGGAGVVVIRVTSAALHFCLPLSLSHLLFMV